MKVLLNITEREAREISGDVSFYRNLVDSRLPDVDFEYVKSSAWPLREFRKALERANSRILPRALRRGLLLGSRINFIPSSSLVNIDLVLSHILFPLLGKRDAAPVIWSSQGISPAFYYDKTGGAFDQSDVATLYNSLGNRSDCLMIWTESQADEVERLCDIRKPIEVLPPIIHLSNTENEEVSCPARSSACHVLFVGRDLKRKGFFELLEAWERLVGRKVDIALDVVGRFDPDLRASLEDKPGVSCFEDVSDKFVSEMMRRADVFALPTHAETYGFVLVEAMARGCALIGPNYSPLNELIREGKNGLLIEPGEVDDLEIALGRLASDLEFATSLARNGMEIYEDNYSPNALLPRYSAFFKKLAGIRDPEKESQKSYQTK